MREMLLSNTSRNGDMKTIIVRSLVKRSIRNSGMKHCDVLQGRVSRCTMLNRRNRRWSANFTVRVSSNSANCASCSKNTVITIIVNQNTAGSN